MTMRATVAPRAETTGILLRASTPKEVAVVRAEMRIDGGGGSWRLAFSAEKMA